MERTNEKPDGYKVSLSSDTAMLLQAIATVNKANDSVYDALETMYGNDGGKVYLDNIEPKFEEYKMAIYKFLGIAIEQDEYISKPFEPKL